MRAPRGSALERESDLLLELLPRFMTMPIVRQIAQEQLGVPDPSVIPRGKVLDFLMALVRQPHVWPIKVTRVPKTTRRLSRIK